MHALDFEIKRQVEVLESGGRIDQETRLFDEESKTTLSMRSKEDAPDYRYFPDPDLVNVEIDEDFVKEVESRIPELPDTKLNRIIEQFKVQKNDAVILTKDKAVSDFFGICAPLCQDKKKLSHWIIKELFRLLNEASVKIEECKVTPERFSSLINLITSGDITESIGRTVLEEMFASGAGPETIIDKKGLKPIADDEILEKILAETMAENPKVVDKIKAGEMKPIDFLIGQVMKKTKGKANAKKVKELVHKKLGL
jgi:aspartyl-tRNA(Asn)/glutamyl-tRNA(Gln) amidotransferase subunit B